MIEPPGLFGRRRWRGSFYVKLSTRRKEKRRPRDRGVEEIRQLIRARGEAAGGRID
jgi:hypothetical protein